jgi:hypothetical protein
MDLHAPGEDDEDHLPRLILEDDVRPRRKGALLQQVVEAFQLDGGEATKQLDVR